MMKKHILFLMALIWLLPNNLSAQDEDNSGGVEINWAEVEAAIAPLEEIRLPEPQLTTGSNGERQVYLGKNERAPWSGVLLNPPAVAYIIAEYEASFERARAALERQRESDWFRLKYEIGRLELQIESERRQSEIIIENLENELETTQRIHERYVEEREGGFWNTPFGKAIKYGAMVIVVGGVGFAAGYGISAATN